MAARQWTQEQRKAQAEKIRLHKIWKHSTGATSEEGKKAISQNALKTGEYTADKINERKQKAANKKMYGSIFSCGDKRFKWDRSTNYVGALKTLKRAEREKLKNRLRAEVTAAK